MALLWVIQEIYCAHVRLYTRAQDTLDPDDPIFPRAATRVGMKYQANVLSWEEQQAVEANREAEAGPSRHLGGMSRAVRPS